MKTDFKIIAAALVFLFSSIASISQEEYAFGERENNSDEPLYYFGIYGAYNYNVHFSNFDKLPGIPNCCPEYENGTGSGFSIGALFEYPIKKEILFGVRAGFSSIGAALQRNEIIGNTLVVRNGDTSLTTVETLHSLDSKILTVGVEPYINYKFFGSLCSYVGFRASYVFTGEFDQKEKLTKPNDATFSDGRRIQNDFSGVEIPDKSPLLLFGMFGVGYDLPAGEDLIITPEIRYYLPINDVSSVEWKASSWNFGATLKFPIYPAKEIEIIQDTVYVRDTTVISSIEAKETTIEFVNRNYKFEEIEGDDSIIEKTTIYENYEKIVHKEAALEASIKAIGIKPDGTRQENPMIVIEEIETEKSFPILPFVFFESGESELKYTDMETLPPEAAKTFEQDSLPWDAMEIYPHILNVIGYRMKRDPQKTVTIVGCNSGVGEEENNLQLSKQRALAVRDYLNKVWSIDDSRLKTDWRNLPENPSNVEHPDGILENQRVEIKSSDYKLVEPLFLEEIQRTADPPIIALYPKVKSEAGLKDWSITVTQGKDTLRSFGGTKLPEEIIWQLEDEPTPKIEAPVNISLNAADQADQKIEKETTLTLQQLTIKKKRYELKKDERIERFSLILFDFDKAELEPEHYRILREIKSRIKKDSKVTISGYTDRIGDPEYNVELAKRRINNVQRVLEVPKAKLTKKPVGNRELLYDNDLPQGRSYSRTVEVIIRTPVK